MYELQQSIWENGQNQISYESSLTSKSSDAVAKSLSLEIKIRAADIQRIELGGLEIKKSKILWMTSTFLNECENQVKIQETAKTGTPLIFIDQWMSRVNYTCMRLKLLLHILDQNGPIF